MSQDPPVEWCIKSPKSQTEKVEKYQSCHKQFQCPVWTFQPCFLVAWTFSLTSPSRQMCERETFSRKRKFWRIVRRWYASVSGTVREKTKKRKSCKIVAKMIWTIAVSTHKVVPSRHKSKMECYKAKSFLLHHHQMSNREMICTSWWAKCCDEDEKQKSVREHGVLCLTAKWKWKRRWKLLPHCQVQVKVKVDMWEEMGLYVSP